MKLAPRASLALALLAFAGSAGAECVAVNGVREGVEQCDGADLGGYRCVDLCSDGDGAGLRCNMTDPNPSRRCTFDTTACSVCGNVRLDPGEECDGALLGSGTCPRGGTLRCDSGCRYDYSQCTACGNRVIEGAEQCDGPNVGGALCNQAGETGGTVSCHPPYHTTAGVLDECRWDRSTCWRCGNAVTEPPEECDDGNTVGGDGCGPTCGDECGNGILQIDEQCDDGNRTSFDGCSSICKLESLYDGGGGEPKECNLKWGVGGVAPGASVACREGTAACDRDTNPNQCTFGVAWCLNAQSGGGTSCTNSPLARIFVAAGTTFDPPAVDALLDSMEARIASLLVTAVRSDPIIDLTPPTTMSGLCGSALLAVPQGEQRRLEVEVVDSSERVDHDLIDFTCDP